MKQTLVLLLMALALLFLTITAVWAQSIPVPSNNQSGTIAATNTFQVVQGQTNNRIGCAIQNGATTTSADLMWVYFDKSTSANCSAATKGASVVLQPGQALSCGISANFVLKDQVCITGTSADSFFANFQ